MSIKIFSIVLFCLFATSWAKIYERCELARELKNVHKIPDSQLATWVCIARYESNYNTRATGKPNSNKSQDHGIFQVNDKYWCYPPGKGCNVKCSDLKDDKITDDVACVKKIYNETKKISGDGFTAWSVYKNNCKGDKAKEFIKGCF